MNKILEMIKNEKVEWKKLGDVCEIIDYKRKPVKKSQRIPGEYPYYGANGIQDYINDYIFDGTFLLMGEDGSVMDEHNRPILHWVDNKKIWVNNHAHVLAEKNKNYNLRYIYYFLSKSDVSDIVNGLPPKINQKNLRNIDICFPTLETQEKIVKILDTMVDHFTQLQAELQARNRQYEHYRDKLLSEEYLNKLTKKFGGEVEYNNQLSSCAKVTKLAGYEFTKYVRYQNEGKIIALRGLNVKRGKIVLNNVKYIDGSDFSKLNRSKLIKNDILFTYVGTVGEVGLVEENNRFYLAPNVALIRIEKDNMLPKFLLYILQSSNFKYFQINKWLESSSMKNLTMENIRKFEIPIPPIPVQEHIVSILDDFNKIVTDINEGLPKEIELRQKQYEYYRERLLDFKREED